MQQLNKQPAFELGQIVATPDALAALRKAGQQSGEFLMAWRPSQCRCSRREAPSHGLPLPTSRTG